MNKNITELNDIKEPIVAPLLCSLCKTEIGIRTTSYYKRVYASGLESKILTRTKHEYGDNRIIYDKKSYCKECAIKAEQDYQKMVEEQNQRFADAEEARLRAKEKRDAEIEETIKTNWFHNEEKDFKGVIGIIIGRDLLSVLLNDGSRYFTENKTFTTNAPTIFASKGKTEYGKKDFYKNPVRTGYKLIGEW